MSADNGIYILETLGPEYRVKELMAIDNLNWDHKNGEPTNDADIMIKNARQMWKDCVVLVNKTEALEVASEIEADGYFEYGICFIRIPRKF
jgi:hypothetical protein